MKRYKNPVVSA